MARRDTTTDPRMARQMESPEYLIEQLEGIDKLGPGERSPKLEQLLTLLKRCVRHYEERSRFDVSEKLGLLLREERLHRVTRSYLPIMLAEVAESSEETSTSDACREALVDILRQDIENPLTGTVEPGDEPGGSQRRERGYVPDVVRQWVIRMLLRTWPTDRVGTNGDEKSMVEWVIEDHLENEQVVFTRWVILDALAKTGHPGVINELVRAVKAPYEVERDAGVQGLREYDFDELEDEYRGVREEAVLVLCEGIEERMKDLEKPDATTGEDVEHEVERVTEFWTVAQELRKLVESLGGVVGDGEELKDTAGGKEALSALLPLLVLGREMLTATDSESEEEKDVLRLMFAVVSTLGEMRALTRESDDAFKALVDTCFGANRILAVTACNTVCSVFGGDHSKVVNELIEVGLRGKTRREVRARVADAMRRIDIGVSVDLLTEIPEESPDRDRAEELLRLLGGGKAFGVLTSRMSRAKDELSDLMDMDEKTFGQVMEDAKAGYDLILRMARWLFWVGIIVVIASLSVLVLSAVEPGTDLAVLGSGGLLAGLLTALTVFFRGPLQEIDWATSSMYQARVAIVGYLEQLVQSHALFEKRYLETGGLETEEVEWHRRSLQELMRFTMEKIQTYTIVDRDTPKHTAELTKLRELLSKGPER